MQPLLAEQLHAEGLLSDASLQKIKEREQGKLFSVHWELRTLLYLGVLLLSSGLGILVYKNIDTIGHQAVLAFIALVSAGCFYYCARHQPPFSTGKVASTGLLADYLLLLACLSFVSLVGYWQYQYGIFGHRYGLAFFIPLVVLLFSAYYFDHLGVLGLAITNLAAWAGIAITPLHILNDNDFDSPRLILTGILLGILLLAIARASEWRKIKAHFAFTYTNFGMNMLFISCLAALFEFEGLYLLWFLVLAGVAAWFYREAMRRRSFYFVLMLSLYGYIGLGYTITRLLFSTNFDIGALILDFMYFIGSATGLIIFLVRTAKKMKRHDSI
jgi:MFS family permease